MSKNRIVEASSVVTWRQTVDGVVEHGDKRGRVLGFPTANVDGIGVDLEDGVWAGTVQLDPQADGPTYVAAISLGRRPTYYEDGSRLIEAFLLDFSGDIYGRRIRVRFSQRVRSQAKFSESAELVGQLHLDVEDVRAWAAERKLRPTEPTPKTVRHGRWGPTQRRRAVDTEQKHTLREERRQQLVQEALRHCDCDALDYQWLSLRTGLPVGYLAYRYPALDALRSAAAKANDI